MKYTIFNDWFYGTCFDNLDENNIFVRMRFFVIKYLLEKYGALKGVYSRRGSYSNLCYKAAEIPGAAAVKIHWQVIFPAPSA